MRARERAEERVLDLLLPPRRRRAAHRSRWATPPTPVDDRVGRARARSCAACCARASSTTARSSSRSRKPAMPMVEVFTPQGMEEMEFQLKDVFANLMPKKTKKQHVDGRARRSSILTQEEAGKLLDMEQVTQGGDPPRRAVGHRLHRRDRQDRRPPGRRRPRRLARGRAARPAADRRGLDREHQVRHGAHRPHPVHRRRRVPHQQAVRPASPSSRAASRSASSSSR